MPASPALSSRIGSVVAATALRDKCRHVIAHMLTTAPVEAYLYRGNAYMALGQPYFAVADYKIAASLASIGDSYMKDAEQAVDKLPQTVTGVYPAVSSYLHFLVEPLLGRGVCIQEISPSVGRGVFATSQLSPGDTALEPEDPWVRYPLKDASCAHCTGPLPETRCIPCQNKECHEEYCSRECRRSALNHYHSNVCEKPSYQAIELDLFHTYTSTTDPSEKNAIANYMLATRICAVTAREKVLPCASNELKTLTGKISFSPAVLSTSVLSVFERTAQSLGFLSSFCFEDYVSVLAKISGNVFQTEREIGLYIGRSMFNHACDENVVEDAKTKRLVCKRGVASGEELTINYYPRLRQLPFEERHKQLMLRGLHCECKRCTQKL